MLSLILASTFMLLCAFGAMKDVTGLTIPNWVNLAIALLFIPAVLVSDLSWQAVGWHVTIGLAAFVATFIIFCFGVFGGGDAKMISAGMLWMGPTGAAPFLIGVTFAGGALALLALSAKRFVPVDLAPERVRPMLADKPQIPYGVAIFAGALYASSSAPLLSSFLTQFAVTG